MKRLFTFGCSFTQYGWPTWADILGRQFDHFENWGQSGAGNLFVACAVSECDVKNNLQANDTVVIMWSSTNREDRYHDNHWDTRGNVFSNSDLFGQSWIRKFADPRGYILRDLAMINLVSGFLKSKQVPHYFLTMQDLQSLETRRDEVVSDPDCGDVFWHYKPVVDLLRPSVHQVIFNYDYNSRPSSIVPRQAQWNATQKSAFRFNANNIRQDSHPSPLEHLEYLDQVLPEISIDPATRQWVSDIDQKLQDPDFDISTVWANGKHSPTRL